ncbi:NTE family protein [Bacillus mesophilus]|uniref:Patatin-like phospholipase family protein n=1 Tax=Bacillus mesophilus TaxID=1808955 RepID=A0A6M0Q5E2_9BACI|nr:NTE family protein [Bacillus mesophilus]NEY71575.1 patatin-like phospholipase family protein [Bacillus mesophilus]
MKIDGVFSGGGIKGYALIGAIQAIEDRGHTFVRMAGTSAGSILAAFLAVGYRGTEIQELMEEVDLQKFMDPRNTWFPEAFTKWILLYWRLGLYKGEELEKWIEDKLLAKNVRVFSDLPPERLRIVASDITNGRMIVFPDDLSRYGYEPGDFPIAKALRMSAGIPYFFEPVKLGKKKDSPFIVDGALLSNFPLWLFQETRNENKRPLLGIQLSPHVNKREKNQIKNSIDLFKALFETMMDAHDLRYVSRSVEQNIIFIPVNQTYAREFSLNIEQKTELIQAGYKKAEVFLKNWSY